MSDPQNPNEATSAADGAGGSWQPNDPNAAQQPGTGQDAINQTYGPAPAQGQSQFQQQAPGQFPPNGQPSQQGQPPFQPNGLPPQQGQVPPAAATMGSSVPAKTGNVVLKRIIGIVVVVALAIGGRLLYGWITATHDATKDVGQCVALSGTKDDVKTERVDCSTEGAYYVAKAGSDVTCTDVADTEKNIGGVYDEITITSNGTRASMCLVPQMVKDACYPTGTSDDLSFQSVDCSSTEAYFRIDEIIEEYDATCPDTSTSGLTYDEPGRTYCISIPE
ncbi:hypothetical protein [Propionibacterium australiense]|uniref:Uncharacterized protein n=1 Tax=Propionibacterium australiense TaxID=119981 RepID=A0A8B3FQZ4_9ACTN|nr:hypothetical protein [Propionibacterium australiense]RLP08848.1 hypothetical protein D7U36_08470 [Propionibacterium australiense]